MKHLDRAVLIVVVAYNSEKLLPDLIASLDAGMGHLGWHLVVVDNASTDGSVAVVRDVAPDATVVELAFNAGYAAGINAGVATAEGYAAILVLNPDVRLARNCVPTMMEALERPGIGIVVPRLLDAQSLVIKSMRREPTVLRALADALIGGNRAGQFPRLGEVVSDMKLYGSDTLTDWAEGSTQLISPACWAACAPWDESFFLYSEEADFDLRARDKGFATKFVTGAEAVHLEGDSATSPKLWALLAINRVRLFRRRHGLIRTSLFWLATVLRESSRALLGKQTSREALRALLSRRILTQQRGPQSVA